MIDLITDTKFASSERVNNETIEKQKLIINRLVYLKPFLDYIPGSILVLNEQRQIVFANKPFIDFIKRDNIYGMRAGECLNCIHAFKESGGCGTSENCSQCGAIKAVLNSSINGFDIQECRITQENNDVLELNVWAKSVEINGITFTLVSFLDISNEKRRKVLEKIFFHDVLNTAGSLKNFLGMIPDGTTKELKEFLNITETISNKLIDEILAQRTLTQAENGDLQLEISSFSTKEILEELIVIYKNHSISKNKNIKIGPNCSDLIIGNDKTILRRILGNLLKNALESCKEGETVTLNCIENKKEVIFYVKNPEYIPKDIQYQIFQRSFSTKGSGRGIGTYSIKLLTEKYLGGSVEFESNEDTGTTFSVAYNMFVNSA